MLYHGPLSVNGRPAQLAIDACGPRLCVAFGIFAQRLGSFRHELRPK
jgi:hypothetical protein